MQRSYTACNDPSTREKILLEADSYSALTLEDQVEARYYSRNALNHSFDCETPKAFTKVTRA